MINRRTRRSRSCEVAFVTTLLLATVAGVRFARGQSPDLESGWHNPPREARLRAYWWWLNGNVTAAAITRDLEQMKKQGFGGALICDADGSSQDGNQQVPHGPDFFSSKWRVLFRHALHEADRLGLEMSLNIQSGWNLGGPVVTASDAVKKLAWSEMQVDGPGRVDMALAKPQSRDEYYEDLFVLAYPMKVAPRKNADATRMTVTASSAQDKFPAGNTTDDRADNFWVSRGVSAGQGPTLEKPEWMELHFSRRVALDRFMLEGRPGYGPRDCELQISDDGRTYRALKRFKAGAGGQATVEFSRTSVRGVRLMMFSAYDPRFPEAPRNVQVTGLRVSGPEGTWPRNNARRPIQNLELKALRRALHFSAPDTTPLLTNFASRPGEEDATANDIVDLTEMLDDGGHLHWTVPDGRWQILRFGCTIGDHARVSTSSDGWKGYALDVMDAAAFQRYWDSVVEPLISDAGPLAGTALKYLHTDSWEVEVVNWTPTLREEFRRRRGYDMLPYLPVVAGRIIDSRVASNRFLNDFRKTLGDLAIDHHYRPFRAHAHRHGLEIHPESGGPHAVPVDAQRCLGYNDVPMSEFWARSWRHRIGDENRFFVKQPASAAHTYGHRIVAAEGFTTIGPHWQETLWDNLKPSFDHAACEGLNRLVWHAFTCSPSAMGVPGQEYFAGTHFNPNSTWWSRSAPFLAYINRCQWMLQQGQFVADACYYYGDHVPNFAQLKKSDPAGVLPGYDYDVATEEVVLTRMSVSDGRLVLPDGMSYRVLVLPNRPAISLPVLRKVSQLVEAGATVIGPQPRSAMTLTNYPTCDHEIHRLANRLWGAQINAQAAANRVGQGRVFSPRSAREVLRADGVPPDFEFAGTDERTSLDYIHRRCDKTDIYFIASRTDRMERVECTFRAAGRQPELWDPMTAEIRPAGQWSAAGGRTTLPIQLPPYGSLFVVFRTPARPPAQPLPNWSQFSSGRPISGPWTVRFDPAWGGPSAVEFQKLVSWTDRAEVGIRYYSGTATYETTFKATEADSDERLWIDLGSVRELAEVRLNGESLGILWAPPFRVSTAGGIRLGTNRLEVDVVNFWPNRVIGDQLLPPDRRYTRTNIRRLTKDSKLVESGLFGPVVLLKEQGGAAGR